MDLADLYRDVIIDHNRNPRNFRKIPPPCRHAEGLNPLCGDKLHVYLRVGDDDRIEDVSFEGSGCAISVASASLMTEALRGHSRAEAEALFEQMHAMLTGPDKG
jgi:nitrogen fixation protein NifU and related proteins